MPVASITPVTATEKAMVETMLRKAEMVLSSLPPEEREDLYVVAFLLDPHTTMFGGVALRVNTTRNWRAQQAAKGLTELQAKWLYSHWLKVPFSHPVPAEIFDGWGDEKMLRDSWRSEQEVLDQNHGAMLERFWGLVVHVAREVRQSAWIPDSIRQRLTFVLDDNHTYDEEVMQATALANPDGQADEWLNTPLPVICCQGVLDTRVGVIR